MLSPAAHAQAVECSSANADGSYTVPPNWALTPSGVSPGTKFRLLFVTSTARDAQSSAIADYNTFVQTRAKAGHSAISDSCGNRFKAVGSTATVDARANVDAESTDTDAQIWWLGGVKAADNYADFWDGSWDSQAVPPATAAWDESGTASSPQPVWTGSNTDGTKDTHRLGGGTAFARVGDVAYGPMNFGSTGKEHSRPLYALSPVFVDDAVRVTLITSGLVGSTATVAEGGTFSITVRLSEANASGSPLVIPIRVRASGTTASSGDYTLAASASIANGDTTGTVQFAATDDTDAEPAETVVVELGALPTGIVPGTNPAVTLTIPANDATPSAGPPLVLVEKGFGGTRVGDNRYEIAEGSDMVYTLSLVRPAVERGVGLVPVTASRDIDVRLYINSPVHDYTLLGAGTNGNPLNTVRIQAGRSSESVLIRLGTSTAVESDTEMFLMFVDPPGSPADPPYRIRGGDLFRFAIQDGPDGTAGNFYPTATIHQWGLHSVDGVAEGDRAVFDVQLVTDMTDPAPSPAKVPFTVHLKVEQTGGDCLAPGEARVRTLRFRPREWTRSFGVRTVDDGVVESDCTVRVSLARADGTVPGAGTTVQVDTGGRGGYTIDTRDVTLPNHAEHGRKLPHRAAAVATVLDDDAGGKVYFVTSSGSVRESTAGTVNVEVAVDPPPPAPFDLAFRLSGTAAQGADYTIPGATGAGGTVRVPSGATRVTIPVTVIDDPVEDSGEVIYVRLLASGGYAAFVPGLWQLEILNHEAAAPDWTDYRTVVRRIVEARDHPTDAWAKGGGNAVHMAKWNRVLEAVGHDTGTGVSPMPASEIHANAAKWPESTFHAASAYLKHLESLEGGSDGSEDPAVTVSAGSAVTEGGSASFVLTASPAPASALDVEIAVTAEGDYGITAGTRTVT
ncbi:MAG: hypothetical protein OXN16_05215, partial [Gammaproteobacteria bacterium]|nr:hypothetical protein [Gammaproteobacteria bacterium]